MHIDKEPIRKFIDDVREIFQHSNEDPGHLIFRGEPKCYPEVRSSLLRKLGGGFSEAGVDSNCAFSSKTSDCLMAQEADPYFGGGLVMGEEFEALAVLQHYGAPTSLIDFSEDWRVAMYFACERYAEKCGRIVFFSSRDAEQEYRLSVRRPKAHQHDQSGRSVGREMDQKSVLVSAESGEFAPHSSHVQTIPHKYKPHLLAWLRSQGISRESVYRDVHGYVSLLKDDESWESLHVARILMERCQFQAAEKTLNRLISEKHALHIEQMGKALFLLGKAIQQQGDAERALEKYQESSELLLHRSNGIEPRLGIYDCVRTQGDPERANRAVQSMHSLW